MADRTSKLYNGVYKATNITGGPDLVSCHGYLANTRNMVINGDFTNIFCRKIRNNWDML
jgi:hypothetical protein